MLKKMVVIVAAALAMSLAAPMAALAESENSERLHERDYQKILCANSAKYPTALFEMEYKLADESRVDCLIKRENLVGGTELIAVEVDFAHNTKPYECVGQAQYYAEETGAQKAICLLILRGSDKNVARAVNRAKVAGKRGGVIVWCIDDDISRYKKGDLSLFGCPDG